MAKKVTSSKKQKPVKKIVKAKGTQEIKMTEDMKKLLSKPTIESYVDYSIKSSLTPAEKRFVTRKWLDKTGHTIEDINYTRNRHPYWKKVKMNGAAERRKTRMEKYDYSNGKQKKWGKDELLKFIDLNPKQADFELAKVFKCSIPSVQGIRRLYNLAAKILEFEGKGKSKPAMHKLMLINEKALREMYKKMNPSAKRKKK